MDLETVDLAHELFEASARRRPDAIAAMFGDERLTFRELNVRANRLAHDLQSRGVGPDVLVSLYVERSLHMIVGILGILKAGGAYVPIDPDYPPGRVRLMLQQASARLVLTQASLIEGLPDAAPPAVLIDAPRGGEPGSPDHARAARVHPENLAYVIFTSGSTGRPKGVQVPHRALVNLLRSMGREPGLEPGEIVVAITTVSFDVSVNELLLPLAVGATLVIADRATAVDGSRLLALLAAAGATTINATPSTYRLLVEAGWGGALRLRSLCGGEPLTASLSRALVERSAEVWNLYGPTETTIWSSTGRISASDEVISIGRPIDATSIHVLDPALRPVSPAESGELVIGGAGVARGYLAQPAMTAERFVPDPFSEVSGARMYRTGDYGRALPDGALECLGRVDHQLKIRGYRIEPGEISAVLEEHPGVAQAVVAAYRPRPEEARLVAYFVARGEAAPVPELRLHLEARLPAHMIPASIIALEEMPLSPNGKLNRSALPAPTWEQQAASHYVEPSTPAERALAEVWSQALGAPRVGAGDNFFMLGGNSFSALKVVSLAAERGYQLSVADFIGNVVLARVAAKAAESPLASAACQAVTEARSGSARAISGPAPLMPQQRAVLPRTGPLDLRSSNLTIQLAFTSPRAIDLERAEAAVRCLVAHHEALRLRFHPAPPGEGPAYTQTIAPTEDARHVVRLDPSRSLEAADEDALQLTLGELHERISPTHGPLLMLGVLEREAQHHLVFVICSLVSDGFSDRLLVEDFQLAYGQLEAGEPVTLPRVGTPFSLWSERLCQPVDLPEEALSRLPARPADTPRAGISPGVSMIAIEPEELQALKHEALHVRGTRIDEVMTAALVISLAGEKRDCEVPLTLTLHGRTPREPGLELSRTVGPLALVKIVRLTVPERAAPWDSVLSVRDQLREEGGGVGASIEGVQRFYHRSAAVRDRLARLLEETVQMHYHPGTGEIDRPGVLPLSLDMEATRTWQPRFAEPAPALEKDPAGQSRLQMTIVDDPRFFACALTFDADWHTQDEVDRLAQAYLAFLRSLR